jgi:hypothetical protein
MPRYFFNIADAHTAIACKGQDLPLLQDARCYAVKYAGQVLCDQDPSFWQDDDWVLTVSDENKLTLLVVVIGTVNAPATARAHLPVYS